MQVVLSADMRSLGFHDGIVDEVLIMSKGAVDYGGHVSFPARDVGGNEFLWFALGYGITQNQEIGDDAVCTGGNLLGIVHEGIEATGGGHGQG